MNRGLTIIDNSIELQEMLKGYGKADDLAYENIKLVREIDKELSFYQQQNDKLAEERKRTIENEREKDKIVQFLYENSEYMTEEERVSLYSYFSWNSPIKESTKKTINKITKRISGGNNNEEK